MDTDFWHERWQANQIGFHQDEINVCLERFWPALEPGHGKRVFVPLCGKSHDMRWLQQQGYKVIGNELSPLAVEAYFSEHGLTPEKQQALHYMRWRHDDIEILCGDFFHLNSSDVGTIDAFYDRASLIALTPAQRPVYAKQLANLLSKDTPGLLVTLDYNQLEMSGPPFAVSAAEVEQLFSSNFEIRQIYTIDSLAENRKFRERGLTELSEHAYHLTRR
jgi:thiopurine S-methyltransferase